MEQPDQAESSTTPPAEGDFSPLAELGLAPERRSLVRKLLRFFGIAALVVYFGFAAAVLALRFWILPQIEAHPEAIAQIISRNIGQRVSIGSVDSGWQRLHPYLALTDVRLYDQEGRVALSLPSVSCTLAWDSLAFGALRFDSLSLDKPQLAIRRDNSGMLHVAGVRLDPEVGGGGFADWLLAQREVIIRDAFVSWEDQLRQAPLLSLTNLNFVMRNRGSRHRFALRALPPRESATALDLRGDLEGRTFEQLQASNGKLYADLAYADLAGIRKICLETHPDVLGNDGISALFGRLLAQGFVLPRLISCNGPVTIEAALEAVTTSGHGALDTVEGAVWRIERNEMINPGKGGDRKWKVDFVVKFVRPEKQDGIYLPEISGNPPVYNEYV